MIAPVSGVFIVDQSALLTAAAFLFFGICSAFFVVNGLRGAGGIRGPGYVKKRLLYGCGMTVQMLAAVALPFVSDLLLFFILWETISLATVAVLFCEPDRVRLLRWYFPIQIAGAVALLLAIALHVAETGSFQLVNIQWLTLNEMGFGTQGNIMEVGGLLETGGLLQFPARSTPSGLSAGVGFALVAIFIKAALFPLHIWMVETYPNVRPSTTVLLSAFGTKSGVFAALRLVPGTGGLELFGALSALLAVLYALRQSTLRRFLSFHIASQIGYMIAGIGAVGLTAQLAGVYHLSNHIMYKGLLLMTAAVLVRRFSGENMYEIRNAGEKTNWPLFLAALIGALSISGVPPFNGFVSKAFLKANMGSPLSYWLLVAASVGTSLSFTKFLWLSFLGGHLLGPKEPKHAQSADTTESSTASGRLTDHRSPHGPDPAPGTRWSSAGEGLAMSLLSLACIAMTFLPLVIFPDISLDYPFSTRALIGGIWPAALGAAGFFLMYRYLLPLLYRMPDGRRSIRVSRVVWRYWSTTLRALHTGDLRDAIGWMLCGLLAVWTVLLLL